MLIEKIWEHAVLVEKNQVNVVVLLIGKNL